MTYKYVSSLKSEQYIQPPHKDRCLSNLDVPEQELEMRDILADWLTDGLFPIVKNESNYISESKQKRFDKLTQTVQFLLKNKDYYYATKRVISLWDENCLESRYIQYLMISSRLIINKEI